MDTTQPEMPGAIDWDPANLRTAAQSIAMAWFAMHGIASSLPVEPQPYDLLLATPTGIDRVQVKSTTYKDPYGKYMAAIGKRRTHGPNRNRLLPYRSDEIDSFFIVDTDLNLYLIPVEDIAGKVCISLPAWDRFRLGSMRMTRPAKPD